MSIDLAVPLIQVVNCQEVIKLSETCLRQLLHQSDRVEMEFVEYSRGDCHISFGEPLTSGKLYLVRYRSDPLSYVELIILDEIFDVAEFFPNVSQLLTISITGAGKEPLAMAAAVAWAVAHSQGTIVIDDNLVWTDKGIASPAQFIERWSTPMDFYEEMSEAGRTFCLRMNKPPFDGMETGHLITPRLPTQ